MWPGATRVGVVLSKMQFEEQVPLAPYTTFGIGGPARWFAQASSEEEVLEGVLFARKRGLPLFVLGGGSNLLVSDTGFPGLVLRIGLRGIRDESAHRRGVSNPILNGEPASESISVFSVAAGEEWDRFVSYAVERDCAGIECLAGIPGSVGGTPVQNVGAYGQEVSDTITRVRAFDLRSTEFVELPAAECGFAYRRSIFNSTERNRYIVTEVSYRLLKHGAAVLSYADLKRYFENCASPPSLAEVADAVRNIRRQKGMLLVEGDPDCASAGSFFKNPVVPEAVLARIEAAAPGAVPHYAAGAGLVKIPAAWLLEQSGFRKGYTRGRAGLSLRHALALTNRGGATAAEILALKQEIVAEVEARFGIRLEAEPVWVE